MRRVAVDEGGGSAVAEADVSMCEAICTPGRHCDVIGAPIIDAFGRLFVERRLQVECRRGPVCNAAATAVGMDRGECVKEEAQSTRTIGGARFKDRGASHGSWASKTRHQSTLRSPAYKTSTTDR
jgi:hypothetical protein